MGNYPSTTNYSPSSNHWTFATGKLFVKDRLTFFLVDSKLKKTPTTPKTPLYRQFIPRPGLSSGRDIKKMQAFRSKGYFKERWVPARAQLCYHCSGKKAAAILCSTPSSASSDHHKISFYFLFNAHWAGFKVDSSYLNQSLFLALASKTHKPPTLKITIILEKQTQI